MAEDVLVVIGVGGIGEAIARRSGAGRKLLLADFDADLLAKVSTALSDDGFIVESTVVDVSSRSSVAEVAQQAARSGGVTGAVLTAGLSPAQAPAELILRVNLAGAAYFLDEFGTVVGAGGAGVVIASMAGTMTAGRLSTEVETALATTPTSELLSLPFLQPDAVPTPMAAYGIAKRANQVRVQAASLDWGARGARVNSVSPGIISTPMGQQELASESGAHMRQLLAASPVKRLGTPSDIAGATAFLLGPDSSFITGCDLLVDGGAVAGAHAATRGSHAS